jgi:queuosine precursor transporter
LIGPPQDDLDWYGGTEFLMRRHVSWTTEASAASWREWSTRRWVIGGVFGLTYIGTIIAANWATLNLGTPPTGPGGPHTIPVWFGIAAPSGTLFAGLAFTTRDLTQEWLGRTVVSISIVVGAVCSIALASAELALASGIAFLVSEVADFAVYTPLRERRWVLAVLASNGVGLVLDSIVFLWIAFNSLDFVAGQVISKVWMTLLALAILMPLRRSVLPGSPFERPDDERVKAAI